MNAPDQEKIELEMEKEMNNFCDKETFHITHISNVPKGKRILNPVWTFKRKTTPSGEVYRHRSRLCVDGSRQIYGEDYTNSYSPVANWTTLRILFILSQKINLKYRHVDYVQEFPQEELDEEVYMRIPAGFHYKDSDNQKNFVLKLKRNLYGLKQAAYNWNECLTAALISIGFNKSPSDPCLFISKQIMCVIYVDDTLFFSKHNSIITKVIHKLQSIFELTDEGDIESFLGIKVDHKGETIEFSQPSLIDKVIKTVGLEHDSKQHQTPAVSPPLSDNKEGAERETTWNYRSAIGQLSYIARNTRPDIEMAVHQCAKYQIAPKRAHEQAIKRIVRYLLATKDKGIIIKPNNNLTQLECYVDADFAGSYIYDDNQNPSSVKSRTGYLVKYAGCPISWKSKLQTEIALSTTEAEYIALSTAARDLIPMRGLILEISKIFEIS